MIKIPVSFQSRPLSVYDRRLVPISVSISVRLGCILILLLSSCYGDSSEKSAGDIPGGSELIELAAPDLQGGMTVAKALHDRTSVRQFAQKPLSFQAVSQLLWAAGGKTVDGIGGATRSYPSAGGLYPLEIYLVAADVESLQAGVYHYQWKSHALRTIRKENVLNDLQATTYSSAFKSASVPACIVVTAQYNRTTQKYGMRGETVYVPIDAGGSAQNIQLQAQAFGIGTYPIGAFREDAVRAVLRVDTTHTPLLLIPCGKK